MHSLQIFSPINDKGPASPATIPPPKKKLFGLLLTGASSAAGALSRLLDLLVRRLGEGFGSFNSVRDVKGLLSLVRATLHKPIVDRDGQGRSGPLILYSRIIRASRSSANNGLFAVFDLESVLLDSNYRIH